MYLDSVLIKSAVRVGGVRDGCLNYIYFRDRPGKCAAPVNMNTGNGAQRIVAQCSLRISGGM
jgi:hypothetical protein